MSDPIEVLDYWLGAVGPDGWYAGGEDLDGEIAAIFGPIWQAAHEGALEHWAEGAAGTLAYLIVCDQFSRNIHRGSALAFATDARARAAAKRAIEMGWDMDAPEPERQFFYMPLEHSEDMADQELAVQYLTQRLPSHPDMALHARAHREVISRFGRFPFRNAALGRENTAQEVEFLARGGYGAILRALSSHAQGA
ncbi:MAG: DUF924 family protein [Cypionkella sp.]|nr:DUF924 family protein [Cypionkella sp.]